MEQAGSDQSCTCTVTFDGCLSLGPWSLPLLHAESLGLVRLKGFLGEEMCYTNRKALKRQHVLKNHSLGRQV